MKVVIIGSGNVATVLGRQIQRAGHEILQVIGRTREHAALLSEELKCPYTTFWTQINLEGDLYLVALNDSVLPELGTFCKLPGKLVVHTAGAVPMDVLLPVSNHCGVLYPLQSLRKEIHRTPEIPFLVDAHIPMDLMTILDFARTISTEVETAGDETRLKLHMGAVLVNNFTNHLYTLTEDYCRQEKISFALLLPIIRETATRLSFFSPRDMQTGPAIRGDEKTIATHLGYLDKYKDINELYKLFTKLIQKYRG